MAPGEVAIRLVALPADEAAIRAVDTSFVTDTVFEVRTDGRGFEITEVHVNPPVAKTFPLDDLSGDGPWDRACLALADGKPTGFAATQIRGTTAS